MKTKTLGNADCRANCHPGLVRVVCALQESTEEEQALDELERARLPHNGLWPQQRPGTMEECLASLLSLLRLSGLLQLSR